LPLTEQKHPKESDLELVVSLSADDVEAINEALRRQISESWLPSSEVVKSAYNFLRSSHPSVPEVFFSYRLRKLVAANEIEADGPVTRELKYQVRRSGQVRVA